MARVIAERLAYKPEHFITHPSEMKLFQSFADDELREFAHRQANRRMAKRVSQRRAQAAAVSSRISLTPAQN